MATKTRLNRTAGGVVRESRNIGAKATASPLVEALMRLGYIVRGLVYGVIGVLALEVAAGVGGSLTDPQGAIVALGQTVVGGIVLYGVFAGLVGYALWGVIRALFDPLHKGSDLKGIGERTGFLVSGISYGLLALATYALISGRPSAAHNGAQGAQAQQTTASILSYSWGPWIVGIAGVIVIGIGLLAIAQGLRGDFMQMFEPFALSSRQRIWIERLGRFGTAARGLVFGLVGLFLALAAYHHDPNQAQGINGVLASLLQQPYGPWLLGLVALGLIAFGIYSALCGVWLRFRR